MARAARGGLTALAWSRRLPCAGAAVLALVLLPAAPAAAEARRDWNVEKCARYRADWPAALRHFGRDGLGEAFLAGHARFLASGCQDRSPICPRSPAELRIADAMTVAAMNAGMASTFLPFRCGP